MEFSPLLLCLLGVFLILIEILFVPGFGLVGIFGFVLLLWGTYRFFEDYGLWTATGIFLGALAFCSACFVIFLRSPASKWIVHRDRLKRADMEHDLQQNQRGRCLTPLYPVGKAVFIIDGKERIFDVSSRGEFIESNQEVEIFMIEGNRVFVKAVSGKVES